MYFNSWQFIYFIIPTLAIYYLLPHKGQNRFLLICSYIFYGAWNWYFLSLIWLSTIVDYFIGKKLYEESDARKRKFLVSTSVIVNLGILGIFKYFNFFSESLDVLLTSIGLPPTPFVLNIVLPVGISFYTFQTLSYTIDIFRGNLTPCRKFLDFALFVAFFPQLVAGPIERASALLPQIVQKRNITWDMINSGMWLILWGYFKKVVIADNLATFVDKVYGGDIALNVLTIALATYAFAYQIYCDFSGYSNIARGLSKLMGIELMRNFDIPYIARSPSEFWERWHISLSSWLRDYLYIPLGGNRHGIRNTYRNLMITMVLGGLWHGAAWNFVFWGLFHGIILIAYHRLGIISRNRDPINWMQKSRQWFSIFLMFQLTCIGWLLFRIEGLTQLTTFISALNNPIIIDSTTLLMGFVLALSLLLIWPVEIWLKNADDPRTRPHWGYLGPMLISFMIILILFLAPRTNASFIYFQF